MDLKDTKKVSREGFFKAFFKKPANEISKARQKASRLPKHSVVRALGQNGDRIT